MTYPYCHYIPRGLRPTQIFQVGKLAPHTYDIMTRQLTTADTPATNSCSHWLQTHVLASYILIGHIIIRHAHWPHTHQPHATGQHTCQPLAYSLAAYSPATHTGLIYTGHILTGHMLTGHILTSHILTSLVHAQHTTPTGLHCHQYYTASVVPSYYAAMPDAAFTLNDESFHILLIFFLPNLCSCFHIMKV